MGSNGLIYGTINDIAPNSTIILWLHALAVQSANAVIKAQLDLASVADPDSNPNNGYDNGEDDSAQLSLRVL